jgi:hypothetical protein
MSAAGSRQRRNKALALGIIAPAAPNCERARGRDQRTLGKLGGFGGSFDLRLWTPYDLDLAGSPTFGWDTYDLDAAMADRGGHWFWHEAACLRVTCSIHVAVCVSRAIVVVVGPPTAGHEISANGKAITEDKVSTKRADEAMADRKPMTCEAADKMRAARHATTESHLGGHICSAEYQGRSD